MIDLTNPPFTTGRLTTLPNIPALDLNAGIGQRSVGYRFKLVNAVTEEQLGYITPLRSATLSHDTTRTIKRQLKLTLGVADGARVDPLTARVEPFMITADGTQWPLGKYIFSDASYQQFTSGNLADMVLSDEMFRVDQQITDGLDGGLDQSITLVIVTALKDQNVRVGLLEQTDFTANGMSWSAGSNRGQILEALALSGDYFSPWFGNDGTLNFIRSFNPMDRVPDFDFDNGRQVLTATVMNSSEILQAPNRFVVISNVTTVNNETITATVDVPVNAPNSFANRGFYIPSITTLQLGSNAQATAVAKNLAQRNLIFERVSLTTAPDPRHDSYNVIAWQGKLWLELSWSLNMAEGGSMTHVLRKSYAAA